MSDFKVGQHITVKLSGGRLVNAEIKAIIETTEGKRSASFVWGRERPDLSLAGCREVEIDENLSAMAAIRI